MFRFLVLSTLLLTSLADYDRDIAQKKGFYPPPPKDMCEKHPLIPKSGYLQKMYQVMEYQDFQAFTTVCPGFNNARKHWSCCTPSATLFLYDVIEPILAPFHRVGASLADQLDSSVQQWNESTVLEHYSCLDSPSSEECAILLRAKAATEHLKADRQKSSFLNHLSSCGHELAQRLAGMACLLCDPWDIHYDQSRTKLYLNATSPKETCDKYLSVAKDLYMSVRLEVIGNGTFDETIVEKVLPDLSILEQYVAMSDQLMTDPLPYEQLLWALMPASPDAAVRLINSHKAKVTTFSKKDYVEPDWEGVAAIESCVFSEKVEDDPIQKCVPLTFGSTGGSSLHLYEEGSLGHRLAFSLLLLISVLLLIQDKCIQIPARRHGASSSMSTWFEQDLERQQREEEQRLLNDELVQHQSDLDELPRAIPQLSKIEVDEDELGIQRKPGEEMRTMPPEDFAISAPSLLPAVVLPCVLSVNDLLRWSRAWFFEAVVEGSLIALNPDMFARPHTVVLPSFIGASTEDERALERRRQALQQQLSTRGYADAAEDAWMASQDKPQEDPKKGVVLGFIRSVIRVDPYAIPRKDQTQEDADMNVNGILDLGSGVEAPQLALQTHRCNVALLVDVVDAVVQVHLSPTEIADPRLVKQVDAIAFSELWAARRRRYATIVQGNSYMSSQICVAPQVNAADMRDFSQLLTTKNGDPLSAAEYIENTGTQTQEEENASVEQYQEKLANARRNQQPPNTVEHPLRCFSNQCSLSKNLAFQLWTAEIDSGRARSAQRINIVASMALKRRRATSSPSNGDLAFHAAVIDGMRRGDSKVLGVLREMTLLTWQYHLFLPQMRHGTEAEKVYGKELAAAVHRREVAKRIDPSRVFFFDKQIDQLRFLYEEETRLNMLRQIIVQRQFADAPRAQVTQKAAQGLPLPSNLLSTFTNVASHMQEPVRREDKTGTSDVVVPDELNLLLVTGTIGSAIDEFMNRCSKEQPLVADPLSYSFGVQRFIGSVMQDIAQIILVPVDS